MKLVEKIIGFFRGFKKRREQKWLELTQKFQLLVEECNAANKEFEVMRNGKFYINYQMKQKWKEKYSPLFNKMDNTDKFQQLKTYEENKEPLIAFKTNYLLYDQKCDTYNQDFVEKEKRDYKDLFDNVEGRALDEQQRECAIKDEINNLVVAGAGSGKTTTIVGKVKYLLERYNYNPDEILVVSFTNASAAEMEERIKKETKEDINVMTFHKLGLKIISEVENRQPSLTDINLSDFVKERFNYLTKKNLDYNGLLNKFFLSYMKKYKSRFNFKNEGEYIDYLRDANIRTFKNEIVKSYEEMEIANFLFINNINYEYEKKYKYNTANKGYRQYKPDFYLTDYDICIEHFGIDKNGNVPSFFQGRHEKSAKDTYNEGIEWKRNIHKQHETTLIETYSWEKAEGVLTDHLKKKLEDAGVKFNPMSRNELWKLIENDKAYELTSFVNLINTFITLLKSNDYSVEGIKARNNNLRSGYERMRNETFSNIIAPIYLSYEEGLRKNQEIDFSDMINKATEYVKQGRFTKKFIYIIVDEYQDISLPRYNLIKTIKDKNNSKLFCVGDDFQSIYRFAGSNIDLFTNFEKYFGYTEKSFIETTYRFNKNLIDLSSRFILKNKSQIKKQLRPCNHDHNQSFELLYSNHPGEVSDLLKEKLRKLPAGCSVALLGRYKNDLKVYLNSEITFKYNYHLKKGMVYFAGRKDLNIEFLTVHKSKGLQADYVFILNNTRGKYGFPSQIEDDPVLNLLKNDHETFEHAEERRLFYVALTRAKKFVYLIVDSKQKSPFIREIEEDHRIKETDEEVSYCPQCKQGKLIYKEGVFYKGRKLPDFYSCSNYPYCDYKYSIRSSRKKVN